MLCLVSCGKPFKKGAIYIFKLFSKKTKNTQPENARIAHRAVTLAKLAEIYHVTLSENAARISAITDKELDTLIIGASLIVGCPANIIPLFAGCSRTCTNCPYFARDHTDRQNGCALKEENI